MEKEQKHSLANDIAEHVKLQQQYDSLYNQSMTILNSLPVAVAVYNAKGKILYFNERFCRIFGTDMEEMAESHPNIYDSPVVTDEIKNAIKAGLPIFTSFPYDFGKVDGYITTVYTGIRYLECNGQPIRNPNGELASYVIIMEDITESLEKEEMLRQSRLKTEIAIKTADIMLWEFDVNSRLFFSDNEPLNGYDKSRPLSIDLYLETIHPEDRKEMVSIMQRMNSGKTSRSHSKDASSYSVLPNGNIASSTAPPTLIAKADRYLNTWVLAKTIQISIKRSSFWIRY